MPINSGIWGEDPNSDVFRYLKQLFKDDVVGNAALDIEVAPGQALKPRITERGQQSHDASLSNRLEQLFPELQKPKKLDNETLVLQIDSFDGLIDDGRHAPPALVYYRYILETRYWPKVIIVDFGKNLSPITKHLIGRYPKIRLCKGDLLEKWRTIVHAKQLVLGVSALAQVLAEIAPHKKRIWLLEGSARTGLLKTSSNYIKVMSIGLQDYFAPFTWKRRRQQVTKLLEHRGSTIVDNGRWIFTETDRCRDFSLCQTCRDTSATGKLWRKMIAARFEVENADWDCPHGWKWGGKPSFKLALLRKLKLGSAFKRTAAALGAVACEDCQQRGEKMDGLRK